MKRKILCLTMLCLLAAAICGCQSQGNSGNIGASAGENSAEAETGTEMETGNEIRMLKADEETEKYVDYFPADGAYSLCEYNAPEEIRRMDIVRVTRKGDQILEEELVTGTDFAGKEKMRSAVIAVWRTEGQKYNIRLTSADGKSVRTDSVEFPFTEGDTVSYPENNRHFDQKIVLWKQYPLFTAARSPENAPSDGSETEESEIYVVFQ